VLRWRTSGECSATRRRVLKYRRAGNWSRSPRRRTHTPSTHGLVRGYARRYRPREITTRPARARAVAAEARVHAPPTAAARRPLPSSTAQGQRTPGSRARVPPPPPHQPRRVSAACGWKPPHVQVLPPPWSPDARRRRERRGDHYCSRRNRSREPARARAPSPHRAATDDGDGTPARSPTQALTLRRRPVAAPARTGGCANRRPSGPTVHRRQTRRWTRQRRSQRRCGTGRSAAAGRLCVGGGVPGRTSLVGGGWRERGGLAGASIGRPGCFHRGRARKRSLDGVSRDYSAFSLQETADSAQYEEKVAHTGWKGRLATHILL